MAATTLAAPVTAGLNVRVTLVPSACLKMMLLTALAVGIVTSYWHGVVPPSQHPLVESRILTRLLAFCAL